MSISSLEAAKTICALSDWTITNLKLQKILYISHLLYLGEKKNALINEKFEAWLYCPVEPYLYKKLRIFGNRPIADIFNIDINESLPENCFIKEKYTEIAEKSAWDLVLKTHLKGGAWEKYFDNNNWHQQINNSDILDEYSKFYAKP